MKINNAFIHFSVFKFSNFMYRTRCLPGFAASNLRLRLLIPPAFNSRQPKITDLRLVSLVQKHIRTLQISMNNILGMQILHANGNLFRDLHHIMSWQSWVLVKMDVMKKRFTFAKSGHNCEFMVFGVTISHEEQDVVVARFLEDFDFVVKILKLFFIWVGHVEFFNCDVAKPVAFVDGTVGKRVLNKF